MNSLSQCIPTRNIGGHSFLKDIEILPNDDRCKEKRDFGWEGRDKKKVNVGRCMKVWT